MRESRLSPQRRAAAGCARAQISNRPVRSLLALLVSAAALSAHAQTSADVQRDAAQQRRTQEREAAQAQRLQQGREVRLQSEAAETTKHLPSGESPCFPIRTVVIEGWPLSDLRAALSGPDHDDAPEDRCLGAQSVDLLMQRVQNALITDGYLTTRVLAKPQDLRNGQLVLSVIPGRLRELQFQGTELAPRRLQTALPTTSGDLLNLRDIEQALENLKRVPTVEADIQIRPGAQPGESDLAVLVQQARPWRLQASLDDSGSETTSRYQGSFTLSYDNLLGLNDLAYIALTRGLSRGNAKGTQGQSAHYSMPYGYWLLGVNLGSHGYHQRVVGLTQDYEYSGRNSTTEVKLSRLVYRDATHKMTLSAKAFQRRSRNFIDDVEVEVQRRAVGGWEAAFTHRIALQRGSMDFNLTYKRGTGAFGSLEAPEEAFGEGSSRFGLINADAAINGSLRFADRDWRYSSALRAQFNRSPLTPQDRFAIGGRFSVRGLDGERSLAAERGWTLRNELGTAVAIGVEAYLGLDAGEVGGPSSLLLSGTRLAGAVLGLRGTGPAKLQFDLTAGRPLHAPLEFSAARWVTTFSLSQSW